jgi:hypothetical protein
MIKQTTNHGGLKKSQSIFEYICVTIVFAGAGIAGFIAANQAAIEAYRNRIPSIYVNPNVVQNSEAKDAAIKALEEQQIAAANGAMVDWPKPTVETETADILMRLNTESNDDTALKALMPNIAVPEIPTSGYYFTSKVTDNTDTGDTQPQATSYNWQNEILDQTEKSKTAISDLTKQQTEAAKEILGWHE